MLTTRNLGAQPNSQILTSRWSGVLLRIHVDELPSASVSPTRVAEQDVYYNKMLRGARDLCLMYESERYRPRCARINYKRSRDTGAHGTTTVRRRRIEYFTPALTPLNVLRDGCKSKKITENAIFAGDRFTVIVVAAVQWNPYFIVGECTCGRVYVPVVRDKFHNWGLVYTRWENIFQDTHIKQIVFRARAPYKNIITRVRIVAYAVCVCSCVACTYTKKIRKIQKKKKKTPGDVREREKI